MQTDRSIGAKQKGSEVPEGEIDRSSWEFNKGSAVLLAQLPAIESRCVPLLANYSLCAVAGTAWYFQFFFYTMGESQMGRYKFSSWTLHMASIIIFGSLWGIGLKEWKGAGRQSAWLLTLALLLLVGSTVIVGYGNYVALAH